MGISLAAQLRCATQELGMRQRVYPRWIARGHMTPEESEKQITQMAAIVETLTHLCQDAQARMAPPTLLEMEE